MTTSAGRATGRAKDRAKARGQQAARGPSFRRLARVGLIAKGVQYLAYGLVALEVARSGSQSQAQQGALATISQQPFGTALLWVLAGGFLGYAGWRALQAIRGPSDEDGAKAAAVRASFAIRAVVYVGLCALAVRTVLGSGGSGGSGSQGPQQATTTVLGLPSPFGVILVVAFAAVLTGIGAYQVYKGVSKKFLEPVELVEMSGTQYTWFTRIGFGGHVARGLVFGATGVFLGQAGLRSSGSEAVGIDGALGKLAGAPYGMPLLFGVAVGLAAYAVWCWVLARYANLSEVD